MEQSAGQPPMARDAGWGSQSQSIVAPQKARFLGIKSFTLLMSAIVFTINLVFAVEPATITTIEKAYGTSSFQMGLWFSLFEAGEVVGGLLISYASGRRHKPRLLTLCITIGTVCCLAHALPYFVTDRRPASAQVARNGSSAAANEWGLCRPNVSTYCSNSTTSTSAGHSDAGDGYGQQTSRTIFLAIYYTASLIWGFSWGPINSLTIVYIEDNTVDKTRSSLFMGLFYSTNYIGAIAGYGLSALVLNYPVDLKATSLTPDDVDWIGAWWLAYVIGATLMAILTVPLLLFPRSLLITEKQTVNMPGNSCFGGAQDEARLLPEGYLSEERADAGVSDAPVVKSIQGSESSDDHQNLQDGERQPSLKRFLPTMWSLVRNPLFSCAVVASATCSWVDGGYFSYIPTYLESQFSQTASLADVESGVAGSSLSSVATILSGWAISHYQLSIPKSAALALSTLLAGGLVLGSGMFFTCQQFPFQDRTSILLSSCTCNTTQFNPVCLEGNTTFYSPCYAGCLNYSSTDDRAVIYERCGLDGKLSATADVCRASCPAVYPYLVAVTLGYSLLVFAQVLILSIVVRSVAMEHRAFGVSILTEAVALVAWIPAPMLYGAVIDATCTIWSEQAPCSAPDDLADGSCLTYDNEKLRYRLHLLTVGAVSMACVSALVACIGARRNHEARFDSSRS